MKEMKCEDKRNIEMQLWQREKVRNKDKTNIDIYECER
jgi:hypothetical protein